VLLILPTVVLGGLQWRRLQRDFKTERGSVPHKAESAAIRLRGAIEERLARLIDNEEARPFRDYGDLMIAEDASLAETTAVTSPLVDAPRRAELQVWFAFDLREAAHIDVWGGAQSNEQALLSEYQPALAELLQSYLQDRQAARLMSRWKAPEGLDVSLLQVAFNRLHKRDLDCLQYQPQSLAQIMTRVHITPFHLQFFVDAKQQPRMLATRRVMLGALPELERYGTCFKGLSSGVDLVQGFLIDPKWMFQDLPAQVARNVLDTSQRFVGWGDPPCCGDNREYHAEIHLLADLGLETDDAQQQDFAPLRIAVDTQVIDSVFDSLRLQFVAMAAMLAISLGTGMWLLLRSVRRDLDQAARTENFVAAVTHELRTPLTSIKMYGEMLLDGDATQPEKQREYYKRIVRATERLSTLVERVLEKSRLAAGGARVEAGDLNHIVSGLERQLVQYGPEGDLRFELNEDVPDVLLTPEAVSSIVSNLVENARKYATVDPSQPDAQPILVRTRLKNGEVRLEVCDRGPGVPEGERARIFDAFYRVGNEATRTARGAGLGLHLVLLQARSIGGDAGCSPREGGGSVFWVSFALAGPAG
jgi:signal transduction histidine kinase